MTRNLQISMPEILIESNKAMKRMKSLELNIREETSPISLKSVHKRQYFLDYKNAGT